MITSLVIRESNRQPHYDIQRDILQQKNGVFTFILKVHEGNISDYVRLKTERFTEINQN